MQAVILAAGKSTRTYPLTLTKPKPLLMAANKTIIEHNLEQLAGIADEVIIVTGYKEDMIKERLESNFGKMILRYVRQESLDGNANALLAAKLYLKDRFIVMNGDDFYSASDIKKCIRHKYCVLVKHADDIRNFGEVITKNGKVNAFMEKPSEKKAGFASTGLLVLDKDIFKYSIKKSSRGEYEIVDFISSLIKDSKDVRAEEVSDYWIPVTYPWSILEANEFFLSKIKGKISGEVEKGAILKGPVIVGKNSIVKAGAYIEGPVVIGEGCSIGPNCYIRSSTSIANDSKIGNAVEIKNSVIGDKTSISHLSYVGDSVIGDNVNFGAGTITANLRHDYNTVNSPVKGNMIDSGRKKLGAIIGDNVHTGINTSIYPGRKIWPNMSTLPGQIVQKDIM
jgi:UDP-N-acetylglucosamine diphosphorylase/glucosamine-1-phosphate N-acetyltransferase